MTMMALLPSIIGAVGSIAGGMLGGQQKETPIQATQRQVLDELLASVRGQGPFSDLFDVSEEAFQRSFVDPAKRLFSTQIAPQIQQSFIAGGQQRGTGLEDALARAGVDLDQMLSQQFGKFQQAGKQGRLGALGKILGAGGGVQEPMGFAERLGGATGGFLAKEGFSKSIDTIFDRIENRKKPEVENKMKPKSKGFE